MTAPPTPLPPIKSLSPHTQRPLMLHSQTLFSFENYLHEADQPSNASLLYEALNASSPETIIYLWGNSGCGRTHLLSAACNQFHHTSKSCLYIPLSQSDTLSSAILDQLEGYHLICLDDLHTIAGNTEWEQQIFYLYNRALETQTILLCSATLPPNQLGFTLADLSSRLSAGLNIRLTELSDESKENWLTTYAKKRGMAFPQPVVNYILAHYSRRPQDLQALIEHIDIHSLIHHKRITIPFIKNIIKQIDKKYP